MVLSYGQEEYIDNKKRLVRYNFFKDEQHGGRDAIFGLDIPLMRLVNVLKSAAERYGTERRVILMHGPVGSSKSTIARLLKRGMEEYSRTPEGALYTYDWMLPKELQHVSGGHETLQVPDARGAAAPDPAGLAGEGAGRAGHQHPRPPQGAGGRRPGSRLPAGVPRAAGALQGRLGQGGQPRPGAPAAAVRAGPGGHRDVPAQGREEPGLHRADRRHQLPEDRRVRIGQRSRGRSTSTASSTSPTGASSSSSRC